MSKRFLPPGGPSGRNPIQDKADRQRPAPLRIPDDKRRTQTPNQVPPNLTPHPFVDPTLVPQDPLPEDRPVGWPETP
ncbi:MAG TPA: hypothetical protein VFA33_23410 [Bryobacteraceae bacterium]|nr:hypothetical protein [Bryobacteraceae bacterium]